MPERRRIAVLGGGAAGFFAAITSAEQLGPDGEVTLFEATPHLLAKVRVSGGGRCNVTHACFEPAELVKKYPRGGRELLGAFHRFQPRDTIEWFAARGVATKTEEDGRMFPTTDDSTSIIDCLMSAAVRSSVTIRTSTPVRSARKEGEAFQLTLGDGSCEAFDRVIIATGGNKASGGLTIATSFGHAIVAPVPSLFTFHISDPRLTDLAGISVENAVVTAPGTKLKTDGPVLITHAGLSGPGILKLSAWGARAFAEQNYAFPIAINWVPPHTADSLFKSLAIVREQNARKQVNTFSPVAMPQRLWERFVVAAGIPTTTPWAHVSNPSLQALAAQLTTAAFQVDGKSMFKDEFVTCGGVKLSEVDFKTMASRHCAGLHFAGEVLDVDGVTGGFNFQNAWTTGYLAGMAAAH
jgi:predicted Rossmann fold flavoprotein